MSSMNGSLHYAQSVKTLDNELQDCRKLQIAEIDKKGKQVEEVQQTDKKI